MMSLLGLRAIWVETKVMQYHLFRQKCREPEGINNISKDQVPTLLRDSRGTVRYALNYPDRRPNIYPRIKCSAD